ncbi:MAG: serine/threonine protein kinase [Bradymonadia bacterium]
MICFRCGSEVPDDSPQCPNCGQRFGNNRRKFTATTTSFRALEKRRARAARATDELPFVVGDVINGRYEIRDLIGRGPLGVIYRVLDQEIELDVALKVMHAEVLPDDTARANFADSVRRMRKLSQQNIVRLYEHDEAKGRAFYTMQLLEGLTLRKVMGLRREKEQRFSVREVEPIFNQITMALGHAHRHTAHGDLKPENILILPDVLKLTDFGAYDAVPRARFVEAQTKAKRAHYLAPETVAGEAVGAPADIYSLGALLYELLSGQPFAADALPVSKVLEQPEEARPGGIDRIISQATAKSPGARYESAEVFSEALGTYIDARELVSVDIRAGMLLPEDITRKFQAPKELQDDDLPTGEFDSSDVMVGRSLPGSLPVSVAAAAAGLPELPITSAEESYVEALDSTDIESMLESSQSLDLSVEVPLEEDKPAFGAGVAPPPLMDPPPERLRLPPPDAPAPEAEHTLPLVDNAPTGGGPWFLRSNVGFVLSIMLVVGVAFFIALRMLDDDDDSDLTSPPVVRVEGTATQSAEAAPETVSAMPDTVTAVPASLALVGAAPSTVESAAPVSIANAPATQAAATQAPRTPSTDAPKARPEAPKTVAARAPKTEARAARTDAPAAPRTSPAKPAAPVSIAALAAPKTQPAAPKTSAPKTQPPAAPQTKAPRSEAADSGDVLKCPSGQLMIRTARFPKGTVKRGKITGAGVAMARDGKAYCIDKYEFPGRGQRPRTSVTHTAASGACKAKGRRLCTDREWLRACVGRGGASFPYGRAFDGRKCNTEDAEGDERSLASAGSFRKCRSAVGAFDMSGNAAEWTADQTVRGGNYASADEDAACRSGGRRSARSARASIGFRCCSDFTP